MVIGKRGIRSHRSCGRRLPLRRPERADLGRTLARGGDRRCRVPAVAAEFSGTVARRLRLDGRSRPGRWLGTLTSMATSQDPRWWECHVSQLGTFDDRSAGLFNISLIIAGFFVTTFALYLDRDLTVLVKRGVLVRSWSPAVISRIFVVLGVMLAGVGGSSSSAAASSSRSSSASSAPWLREKKRPAESRAASFSAVVS